MKKTLTEILCTPQALVIGVFIAAAGWGLYKNVGPAQPPATAAPTCQLREFTPQKDITAFELAFIYKNTNGITHQALCIDDKTLAELDAKVRRHFTTVPPAASK